MPPPIKTQTGSPRELLSLALMMLPLAAVAGFFLFAPSVWTSSLTTFFENGSEVVRRDPGWLIALVATAGASLSAWIGVLGTKTKWRYNRRIQRGFTGSLGAALVTLLATTWQLTRSVEAGHPPQVDFAMFYFLLACLYGVLCLAITPSDLVYPSETERLDLPTSAGIP